jgi:hypothetical protein
MSPDPVGYSYYRPPPYVVPVYSYNHNYCTSGYNCYSYPTYFRSYRPYYYVPTYY